MHKPSLSLTHLPLIVPDFYPEYVEERGPEIGPSNLQGCAFFWSCRSHFRTPEQGAQFSHHLAALTTSTTISAVILVDIISVS